MSWKSKGALSVLAVVGSTSSAVSASSRLVSLGPVGRLAGDAADVSLVSAMGRYHAQCRRRAGRAVSEVQHAVILSDLIALVKVHYVRFGTKCPRGSVKEAFCPHTRGSSGGHFAQLAVLTDILYLFVLNWHNTHQIAHAGQA